MPHPRHVTLKFRSETYTTFNFPAVSSPFAFTQVYATGCDLVIMDQNFERVQIIPGVNYDQVQISCVDCSADCGKIAAAYSNRVCIFAPVPHRAGPGGSGHSSVSGRRREAGKAAESGESRGGSGGI